MFPCFRGFFAVLSWSYFRAYFSVSFEPGKAIKKNVGAAGFVGCGICGKGL
jgi:hypothetical protein